MATSHTALDDFSPSSLWDGIWRGKITEGERVAEVCLRAALERERAEVARLTAELAATRVKLATRRVSLPSDPQSVAWLLDELAQTLDPSDPGTRALSKVARHFRLEAVV